MKVVIFDMDGVLIDSEPLHFEVDRAVLKQLNIDVENSYLDKFVGCTNFAMWKVIKREFSIKKSIEELSNLQIGMKLKILRDRTYAPIGGILDLLQDLEKNRIKMAVASSSPKTFIEEVIDALKIKNYFSLWVSGEEVERSKPEPDVFLRTAELLKVLPCDCVVIEDSTNGVIAAKKAGMKCIGFKNPNSGHQDLREAALVVSKISEISYLSIEKLF